MSQLFLMDRNETKWSADGEFCLSLLLFSVKNTSLISCVFSEVSVEISKMSQSELRFATIPKSAIKSHRSQYEYQSILIKFS